MGYLKESFHLNLPHLLKNKRDKKFFIRPATNIAEDILGDFLVFKDRRKYLVGKIVETEAYTGTGDDASHSFGGKVTERNRIMYDEGGVIYTYLIYGMYWCFNIVVSRRDDPQAVFIRALHPLWGIERMRQRRRVKRDLDLTNGPCRWTMAFGIDGRLYGKSILSDRIFISRAPKRFEIVRTKRVGVDYAKECKDLLLRFYIKGSEFVSRP